MARKTVTYRQCPKKEIARILEKAIFKKRINKKLKLDILKLISAAAMSDKIKWKYGIADPSPLMTTIYASLGKVYLLFRKTEDLSEENFSYSLTLETLVEGEEKSRRKEFSYSINLPIKSTSSLNAKDWLVVAWIYCYDTINRKPQPRGKAKL
ncbi:hypothetical protein M1513_00800 [Patescibacteria group bacterium]|nr:hypothetical protein [Patescibacteria group bacterium]